jgi:ferredoxin
MEVCIMAMMITDDCIACDACLPECPNSAISECEEKYQIDPDLCTECIGFAVKPQCVDVCPVGGIVPDPYRAETIEQLKRKRNKVHINW